MKQDQQDKFVVSLIAGDDGLDRISLRFEDADCALSMLTPAQARALATELITAVNRAEVKANLKSASQTRRVPSAIQFFLAEPQHRLVRAG